MINRIIDACLDNRFVVILLVLVLVGIGLVSARTLRLGAVPDITPVQVMVLTDAPGLSPVEVEQFVTFPIEASMSGLPNLTEIRSVTRFGLSAVFLYFEEGSDLYLARQLVAERLPDARRQIPAGFGEPQLGPISTGLGEIYQFRVVNDDDPNTPEYDLMELRSILDWQIAFQLRSVEGVVEVNTWGGELKTYEVRIDPNRLLNYSIPINRIFEALDRNNTNAGGGYLVHAGDQRIIRGEGLIGGGDGPPEEALRDIENIVLDAREGGTPIYIKDVADVQLAPMIRQGAVTADGTGETVIGIVYMLIGENDYAVVNRVREAVFGPDGKPGGDNEGIAATLPAGVKIVPFYDRVDLVERTIDTVKENISTGAVLVVVMLLLLVGNLRAGLIVASAIPLSALFMVILMNAFGYDANLMSLGAIDFGIIVDGAVVMIENSIRHASRYLDEHPDRRKVPLEVFRKAGHEVGRPILFAGLIVIIVFLPIFSLQGTEGKMFRPMAFTFSSALIGALILSITVMPVMASLFLARRISAKETWLVRWIKKGYGPLLRRVMKHPRITLSGAAAAFAVSVFLALGLGGTFIPELDEGDIALQAWRLPSSSLEQSIESTTQLERVLMQFPEVDTVVSKTGRAELATDPMGVEISDIYAILKREHFLPPLKWPLAWLGLVEWPEDVWTTENSVENINTVLTKVHTEMTGTAPLSEEEVVRLRERAEEIYAGFQENNLEYEKDRLIYVMDQLLNDYVPANTFSYTQPIELRFQEMIAGVRSDIGISLYGPDLETLRDYGNRIATVIQQVPGASGARPQEIAGLPNIRIRINRAAIARYGINAGDVLDTVRALKGVQIGQVLEGQPRFAVQVRFAPDYRDDLESLRSLKVADPSGRQIPLDQLAELEVVKGPAMITRSEISRKLFIEANVRGRDLAGFVADAKKAIAEQIDLPPGYYLTWGGQFKNLQEASARLAIAVPVALFLIFALLYMTFGSGKLTALIYLNVPIAATGGILALWLRDMPFSISAEVGFIALFGIAVMNGVVLVEHIRDLRKRGEDVESAVFNGAMDRLRPVLMTATTDALGFLPMAIAVSAGAEVQRPLATVVIGGVITSSILTLLVLPSIYSWFEPKATRAKSAS